ncbi:uncharacterized protein A1O9_10153 [Exophiala aquamarina CBS 119918]|uniref:Saccharopine dehydrogenase NADP binding domain-containing protein n=1 Tax=Exophiala aquamarina CBS 119918 TaxID=1182545 RepID=A0A072P246_9EURO|nr:uncharacterized protein A1O9_10153 [Exophiala aquamarina CBS 119918]KEF53752.1 hypothetical protein A1O9_10153 [Exophiala aquamarina CBS 119918]
MSQKPRQYDVAVLGATGFTAAFVAQIIATTFPSGTRWTIAARDPIKLAQLRGRLGQLNPKGPVPGIEFAQNTKVLLNAIGPYTTYGGLILEACASTGTSYLDFSTETPWIEEMILKYHARAKTNRAIIIPAIGNSSSPSALIAYLLASQYPKYHGTDAQEIVSAFGMKINGMSGGSLASVTAVVARYGIRHFWSPNPYRLCSKMDKGTCRVIKPFFGYSNDPTLGHLATSFGAPGNEAIVYRSTQLQASVYSPHITYHEFMPVSSSTQAFIIHFLTKLGILLLAIWPFRVLVNKLKPESGSGPCPETTKDEKLEIKAVARGKDGKELKAEYVFNEPMYYHSAILGTAAVAVLLDLWKSQGGHTPGGQDPALDDLYGILTPSCLGMPFVEKLREAGVTLKVLD